MFWDVSNSEQDGVMLTHPVTPLIDLAAIEARLVSKAIARAAKGKQIL